MPRVYTGSFLMLPRSKKYWLFVESLRNKDGKQGVDIGKRIEKATKLAFSLFSKLDQLTLIARCA